MFVALALLWACYYGVHSLLATGRVKAAVARRWPGAPRFYRLGYNQLSVWGFLAAWHWQESLSAPALPRPPWLAAGGVVLGAVGLGLAVAALRGYDLGEFAGWKYVRRAGLPTGALRTFGLNAWVRHPLYLGVLMLVAGAWLVAPTWPRAVFGLVTWAYVLVGLRWEERRLSAAFGPAYGAYRRGVPALWPRWPGKKSRIPTDNKAKS